MSRGTLWTGTRVVLAVLMVGGCAGQRAVGTGGGGWEGEEEARRAEAEVALEHLWSIASGETEEGARLTFSFWAQQGALTLLEYQREGRGGRESRQVEAEAFARQPRPVLREYVRGRTGEVVLTLEREKARWAVDYETRGQGARPPEAKSQPVNRRDVPADTVEKAFAVASSLGRLLPVPSGGAAMLRVEVTLEDDRITGWEHRGYEVTEGGGSPRLLSEQVSVRLGRVLLPFTHGVGRRMVLLELRGEHREGESTARGQVLVARTLRPAPPPHVEADFAAEYRALHEGILRRWREGVREGAELLAGYAAEEMALWYVGGILTRGAGLLFEAAAPTVTRALTQGGTEAAGWLRTTFKRLNPVQREQFERLWTKVQLEGAEALSRAEKDELLTLMNRLERLIRTPLSTSEKNELRRAARQQFERLHPQLHEAMARVGAYEVHHRRPLEYAHLFPDMDINTAANLKAAGREVHQHIGRIWTEFRNIRGSPTADEVDDVAGIIDRHFSRWYDRPQALGGDTAAALEQAMVAARQELQRAFPSR